MTEEVEKPPSRKRRRSKKPDSEKGGKQFRQAEEARQRRSFSCTRLYGVDEQPSSPPLDRQREMLLAKAKHLAFPVDATGKYKGQSVRKLYGRDVSAAGSSGLPALHKSGLHIALNHLLHRQCWPQVAGVLSVLLRAVLAEPSWSPYYSQYFWAAMEVTRQLEGLRGNDWKLKRMFQILHDKQPRGPWSYYMAEDGAVCLQLALYLLSQKQYGDANLASERFISTPPYRGHALANLVYGFIHYYQWFGLIKQDVEQESVKEEMVELSEGVGENNDFFGAKHSYSAENLSQEQIIRLDDDFHSEDTSVSDCKRNVKTALMASQDLKESVPHICQEEVSWNMYDDAEEDSEKSYLKKARILYNRELDERLFPFKLPHHYCERDYKLVAKTVLPDKSRSTAIKHLQDALTLESVSSTALLPLVQLLLAGADIQGAFSNIDQSCHKFNDVNSFRIKCLFLESLTPKNKELLVTAYEQLLKRDPSSTHTKEKLTKIQKND